ncbi:MAG: tetratricopeptide repeat protein, partial [Rikenellaceae bacterium]
DRARALKAALLYKTGRKAEQWIDESLKIDAFNYGSLFVNYLINRTTKDEITSLMRSDSHNYQEIALDFMGAGLWDMAVGILDLAPAPSPMALYYKAYSLSKQGKPFEEILNEAASADPKCCFPNRLEDIEILNWVVSINKNDGKAPYYLGNLFYDKRQYDEAIALWELSSKINSEYPTVWRNLALAYFNKRGNAEQAMQCLEKAFNLDKRDPRVLMELDQLSKRLNISHKSRLERLEQNKATVYERDDLYLEYATLHNNLGQYEKALELINARKFHPWEGGEGKVPAQYQMANLEIAKRAITKGDYAEAQKHINACYIYPHNLGEGKLTGAQENDFNYYMAESLAAQGLTNKAKEFYIKASNGKSEPAAAIYYNDQKPDKIFYQILSLLSLGDTTEAEKRANRLIEYATQHIGDNIIMDYFAVSLPDMLIWDDDLNRRNVIHCNYIMGLGYLGQGNKTKAKECFKKVLDMDNNHQGAIVHSSF